MNGVIEVDEHYICPGCFATVHWRQVKSAVEYIYFGTCHCAGKHWEQIGKDGTPVSISEGDEDKHESTLEVQVICTYAVRPRHLIRTIFEDRATAGLEHVNVEHCSMDETREMLASREYFLDAHDCERHGFRMSNVAEVIED